MPDQTDEQKAAAATIEADKEAAAAKAKADKAAVAAAKPATKARVLVDTGDHKVNSVISGAEAAAAIAAGWADGHPSAVAQADKQARQAARANAGA